MLIALGFLMAALLALAALPALARRAERLARRRAEAAFPLSLAEIAADRDHLRAELALRERTLEQRAQSGFAVKAGAMEQIGRRDMTIGRLERELGDRDQRIAGLDDDLRQTRATLEDTSARLARESADHVATAATLAQRVDDLAALERNLAETRTTLKGTGSDLDARTHELGDLRGTLVRLEAVLAERERELGLLRGDHDALRVAQVEARTQILVLEGKRDELSDRLAAKERAFDDLAGALGAMTGDRDSERLRGDALSARAAQAEAGLAAADARAHEAAAGYAQMAALLKEQEAARLDVEQARQVLAEASARAEASWTSERQRLGKELDGLRKALSRSEGRLETVHAEVQTLQGSLTQARTDRARLKREIALLGKPGVGKNDNVAAQGDNAALRQEIVRIAERLMSLSPKQEAAE